MYSIVIEFRKKDSYDTYLTLYWEGEGFGRQAVPPERLLHYESGYSCGCGEDECSEFGTCANGQCICEGQYVGPHCEHTRCKSNLCFGNDECHDPEQGSFVHDCGSSGFCEAGECVCSFGLTSDSGCTRRGCPGDGECSGAFRVVMAREKELEGRGRGRMCRQEVLVL